MSGKGNRLLDQQKALESFFDSLLKDVEAYAQQEASDAEAAVPTTRAPTALETRQAQKPRPVAKPTLVDEIKQPTIYDALPPVAPARPVAEIKPSVAKVTAPPEVKIEKVVVKPVEPAPVAIEPEAKPGPVALGKPAWAENDFQAMLFKVAGLTLAVPLIDLNGVIEWDAERVAEMPGHADFYLGLMNHLGKNIPLVDTARLVLPPDKLRVLAGDNPLARLGRVVLIHDSDYGLACDEVNEVITLKPEAVRWRSSRTQRRWLAGTVIEHMCALIDANAFAELLRSRAPIEAFRE